MFSARGATSWFAPAGTLLALLALASSLGAQSSAAPQTLEPVKTAITVLEKIEPETPAPVSVIGKRGLEQQPGVNIDDRLRSLPGFTLFRRSSSLAANPTTQGVSLRGLGSSGASRTLVLWDGVPVNDPFGGWVYWTRIPPDELERVEVSRGASTSVFGDRAMSGVISLFTRPAERFRLTAGYEGGNRDSHGATLGGSHLWRRFAVSSNVRGFLTDGYYVVPKRLRGAADKPAGANFLAGATRVDYFGGADKLFLKLDVLAEDRNNGTGLTRNSTSLGTLAANYSREWGRTALSVLGYHSREQYHASFTALTPDRNTERLSFVQSLPSDATGGAAIVRTGRSAWNLLAGADAQRVEGVSTDRLIPTGMRSGGGSQLQTGQFVQTDRRLGLMRFFGGARHHRTGDNDFFSPSAGLTMGRGLWRARGTVYRAFRAPTLNELFREFRVGNTVTQANAALRPETSFGAEAGIDLSWETARLSVTAFRQSLEDLITNVTVTVSPALIVRQRRNAAAALTRGIDASSQMRWKRIQGEFGYLYADSHFNNGFRIPQVPRHQGTATVTYIHGSTLLSGGLRSFYRQFEDDRNSVPLPGYAALQLSARQRLRANLHATFTIENMLNREFFVGPLPVTGAPRLWRLGLRWDGPIR